MVAIVASHSSSKVTSVGAPRAAAVSKVSLDEVLESTASALLALSPLPCPPLSARQGPQLPLCLCASSALQ